MIFTFLWLTSSSMTICRSIHVAENGIISFFLCLSSIPLPISSLGSLLLTRATRGLGQGPQERQGQGTAPLGAGLDPQKDAGPTTWVWKSLGLPWAVIASCCLPLCEWKGLSWWRPHPPCASQHCLWQGPGRRLAFSAWGWLEEEGPPAAAALEGASLWTERPWDPAGTGRMWQEGGDCSSQARPLASWFSPCLRTLCHPTVCWSPSPRGWEATWREKGRPVPPWHSALSDSLAPGSSGIVPGEMHRRITTPSWESSILSFSSRCGPGVSDVSHR